MRPEFEYIIVVLNSVCEPSIIMENLDAMGEVGWELVSTTSVVPSDGIGVDFWYHFKRTRNSEFFGTLKTIRESKSRG